MKKSFSIFAVVCMLAVCLTAFAACATDVDGKTFVYDSCDVEFSDEAKDMAEEMGMDLDTFMDFMIEEMGIEDMFKGTMLRFEDGIVTLYYNGIESTSEPYTQDGSEIKIGSMIASDMTAEAVGGKLTLKMTQYDPTLGDFTVKFVFV